MSMHDVIARYIKENKKTDNVIYAGGHITEFSFWAEIHYDSILQERKEIPRNWRGGCEVPGTRTLFVAWAFDYLVNEFRKEKENPSYRAVPALQFAQREPPSKMWYRINNVRKGQP